MNDFAIPQATADKLKSTASKAADTLQDGVYGAQRLAYTVIDAVAEKVASTQSNLPPAVEKVTDQAHKLMQQGREMVQGSAQLARDKAVDLSDQVVSYTKDEPVKAMLMAAAAGAVLIRMLSMVTRSRR